MPRNSIVPAMSILETAVSDPVVGGAAITAVVTVVVASLKYMSLQRASDTAAAEKSRQAREAAAASQREDGLRALREQRQDLTAALEKVTTGFAERMERISEDVIHANSRVEAAMKEVVVEERRKGEAITTLVLKIEELVERSRA